MDGDMHMPADGNSAIARRQDAKVVNAGIVAYFNVGGLYIDALSESNTPFPRRLKRATVTGPVHKMPSTPPYVPQYFK